MNSAIASIANLRNGLSIKAIALVSLCVHLTVLTIVLHLSRIRRAPGAPSYKSSSAVILTESGKMLASICLAIRDLRRDQRTEEYQLLYSSNSGSDENTLVDEDEAENDGVEGSKLLENKNRRTAAAAPQLPSADTDDFGVPRRQPMWNVLLKECLGEGYLKLAIPALLFTIQNNLQYVASSNLSVPTFQITYQLKIPFTALCSVLLLGRMLSRKQWGSIGLLSIGVAIVQLSVQSATITHHPDAQSHHPAHGESKSGVAAAVDAVERLVRRADPGEANMNQLLGLVSVIISCLCSGFACVYFEKQLKKPAAPAPAPVALPGDEEAGSSASRAPPARPAKPTNLWVRNIQLSFFSLIVGSFIYVLETFYSAGESVAFFTGFTGLAWIVVGLQVGGGLLAALVIKHADNIAKVFATSSSIILSFAASIPLFDYQLTLGAVVGGSAVVGSTYIFAMAEEDQAASAKAAAAMQGSASAPSHQGVDQPPVQLTSFNTQRGRSLSSDSLEGEDLDRAIDDLERSSSPDNLIPGEPYERRGSR